MTVETSAPADARAGTRDRIVGVAADLLRAEGRAAVTTRAVAEAAGVQAPTIYRLFGDKEGLLDAVAETEMTRFAATKAVVICAAAEGAVDAVDDLRAGWDATIAFALDNPELYALMSDPARGEGSPAVRAGVALLEERVHRVALAGRLRVAEPLAVELIHAAATGALLSTIRRPAAQRDRGLVDAMRDAVLDRILTPLERTRARREPGLVERAVALRAHVADADRLSAGERALLAEWLDRIAAAR
ncbi:TetR/AcrR family transcriptional regulator [Clavibacter phaseoli]|uniref:TetR/AcrR family transcriptional regulator n=2 Tax=Clavibacter phaseoli TaxID=1734031 RepID=UPI001F3903E9|nr:TetR/AcrR family transcriptional regulator [Clavibacter phaseoli]UKF31824.1 TetR/AcrR family transcriptional regulator [Clavibacter phaseoli]UKF37744.1 TetR/AcrR family transcriptional regulator [Clavibacter phaseoli]